MTLRCGQGAQVQAQYLGGSHQGPRLVHTVGQCARSLQACICLPTRDVICGIVDRRRRRRGARHFADIAHLEQGNAIGDGQGLRDLTRGQIKDNTAQLRRVIRDR